MFCKNCGAQQNDGAKFCEKCGAVTAAAAAAGNPAQPSNNQGLVGFSQRIHDPVFEKLQKEGFRRSIKHGLIFLPIVVLLFQIGPFLSNDFPPSTALAVGLIVGGFGLVCTLVGAAKRASSGTWDGEVIDKKITEHTTENQEDNTTNTHYLHTIFFSLAGGGKKKMQRKSNRGSLNAWDMMIYLNIGDKVRYHGKLDYYEKYDKSRDAEVPCANCHKFIDIRLDSCPHCHVPVIKP